MSVCPYFSVWKLISKSAKWNRLMPVLLYSTSCDCNLRATRPWTPFVSGRGCTAESWTGRPNRSASRQRDCWGRLSQAVVRPQFCRSMLAAACLLKSNLTHFFFHDLSLSNSVCCSSSSQAFWCFAGQPAVWCWELRATVILRRGLFL